MSIDYAGDFPRREYPCAECPFRRDSPPGQFPAERYAALRATSDQCDLNAPMFGCHKGEPGTPGRDLACAGWLAVAGHRHPWVRFAVVSGRLPESALKPDGNWPALYPSYDEMAAAKAPESGDGRENRR